MKETLLSDLYWRLHRNTTLASLLLFLSSNGLLHISGFEGADVDISDSLISFFLFVWATYALTVFALEGGREESVKSLEAQFVIKQRIETASKIYNEIGTNLNDYRKRIDPIVNGMSAAIKSSVVHKDTDGPIANQLRMLLTESNNFEMMNLQRELNEKNSVDSIRRLKSQIFDSIYSRLSESVKFSEVELDQGVARLNQLLQATQSDLEKVGKLLKREDTFNKVDITAENIRIFFTGKPLPILFYIFSILHFSGLYFPIFSSFLDYIHRIHAY